LGLLLADELAIPARSDSATHAHQEIAPIQIEPVRRSPSSVTNEGQA